MIIKGIHEIATQVHNEIIKYGKYICGIDKFGNKYIVKEVLL